MNYPTPILADLSGVREALSMLLLVVVIAVALVGAEHVCRRLKP